MTLKQLSEAVLAHVPKASRVDISLNLRTFEPAHYRKETVDLVAEISVWHGSQYYGLEAPTYEEALQKFESEMLPKIFPPIPEPVAPVDERLAQMEPTL